MKFRICWRQAPDPRLTPREIECLDLLSRGFLNKAAARELGIKPVTVDMHLANARRKLGASTTKRALRLYRA